MLIPTGFAQANFVHVTDNAAYPAHCTLGFNITAAAGSLFDKATLLKSYWSTYVMATLSNTCVLSEVQLKAGPNDTGPAVTVSASAPGLDGGLPASVNCAYLVRKVTAAGGRSGRGRMYWPGVIEGGIGAGGLLVAGKLTEAQTKATAFFNACTGSSLIPVLLHGEDSPATSPTIITSLVVDSQAATQRRRMRR